jgi:hypothetical protein
MRHARHTSLAVVQVTGTDDRIHLTVHDDGDQVSAARAPTGAGWSRSRSCSRGRVRPDEHPRSRRRRPGTRPDRPEDDPRRPARHRRRRAGAGRRRGHGPGSRAVPRCLPARHPHAGHERGGGHPSPRRIGAVAPQLIDALTPGRRRC